MDDLKPCPFCGNPVTFNHNMECAPDGIRCDKCRIIVRFMRIRHKNNDPFGITMSKMAEAWNRREGVSK